MMPPNPLKKALAEGRLIVGHMVMEFTVPNIAHILRPAQPDFVLFDLEHTGLSLQSLAPLLLSCRIAGIPPVVRVPGFSGHFISRCLDLGALGIMMPNVRTPEEARALVAAAMYPPGGERGMGLGGAHTSYTDPSPNEYAAWATEQLVLIAQIESAEALGRLDDILSVPGIDVGWVGQNDLTLSMGIVGQYDAPSFVSARHQVAQACHRHGKGAGCQPPSPTEARTWFEAGYNVISLGTDLGLYQRALAQGLAQVRSLADGK